MVGRLSSLAAGLPPTKPPALGSGLAHVRERGVCVCVCVGRGGGGGERSTERRDFSVGGGDFQRDVLEKVEREEGRGGDGGGGGGEIHRAS